MAYLKRKATFQSFGLKPGVAPGSAYEGQIYYNASDALFYIYADGAWKSMSGALQPTGGIITAYTHGGTDYIVHTFKSSGIFFPEITRDVDYLVVAAGGSGTSYASDGSGYGIGYTGANSAFGSITSSGGGGGNGQNVDAADGGNGGSGGGGGGGSGTASGGTGINDGGTFGTATYQGHAGGDGHGGSPYWSGGGGGASAVGQDSTSSKNGDGGAGENNVMGLDDAGSLALLASASAGEIVSSVRYLAGGGGGGSWADDTASTRGLGGKGGGGAGGSSQPGVDGLLNTGGGGGSGDTGDGAGSGAGGAGGFRTAASLEVTAIPYIVTVGGPTASSSSNAGKGGSGIVIIRYTA